MLALVLSLAVSSQQVADLDKKISFTSVAKPAKVMLTELSEKSGVSLATAQVIEDEILVIHAKDAPIGEVMKRIASAASADWQREGAIYRLTRTAAKVQELRRESIAKRSALIAKGIDDELAKTKVEPFDAEKAKQIAKDLIRVNENNPNPYNFDAASSARLMALEAKTPAGRLYAHMLRAIDPAAVATLQPGTRVVFSTSPNRMQRALKRDVSVSLKAFANEQAVWAETAKRVIEESGGNTTAGVSLHMTRPVEGNPKALMIITAHDGGGTYSAELMVGDASGRLIGQQHAGFGSDSFSGPPKPEDLKQADDAEVELSPESKQMAEVLRNQMKQQGGGMPNLPLELRKTLADTDERDPLSYITSDALIGWAKGNALNLVASLPDTSVYKIGIFLAISKVTPKAVQQHLGKVDDMRVKLADGWAELSPADPIGAQETRVNRKALAQLLRKGLTEGRWTLDDRATYALSERAVREYNPLSWFLMAMVTPDLMSMNGEELPVLRLYGTLDASRKKALQSGGKFAFSQLTPQQRANIEAIVYSQGHILMVKPPPNPTEEFYQKAYGFGREPTEAMPNGLPPEGYFSLASSDKDIVLGYMAAEQVPRPMGSTELAWDMAAKEAPDKNPWAQGQPPYTLFRAARRTEHQFTFDLSPILFVMRSLYDDLVDRTAPLVAFDKLPSKFQKDTMDMVEHYRKNRNHFMPGQVKPPPPQ